MPLAVDAAASGASELCLYPAWNPWASKCGLNCSCVSVASASCQLTATDGRPSSLTCATSLIWDLGGETHCCLRDKSYVRCCIVTAMETVYRASVAQACRQQRTLLMQVSIGIALQPMLWHLPCL
jgi:hypothetical protein